MNTQEQIYQTIVDYQKGNFPPKRVPWDYKSWADFPKTNKATQSSSSQQCTNPQIGSDGKSQCL